MSCFSLSQLTSVGLVLFQTACSGTTTDSSSAQRGKSVTVDKRGFTPSSITIEKRPAESTASVRFTRTTDDTCARWLVVPDLQRNIFLPLNKSVELSFPTEKPRTLSFQCGTGMFKGSLVVH
jgi:plastocyanin domain-containing protein